VHYTIDKTAKYSTIYDWYDIENMFNMLYICYTTKQPCIISDLSIKNTPEKSEINIIYCSKIYYLTWEVFFKLNNFFKDKYDIKGNFKIPPHNLFTIFLLQLIDSRASQICTNSRLLVGSVNSIFGIYHSYQQTIIQCDHVIYFSFHIFSFILYRVHSTPNYIIGKLIPFIKMKDHQLIVGGVKYQCPPSFQKKNKNIYAIRKRTITFISPNKHIPLVNGTSSKYANLWRHISNQQVYIFKLNKPISGDIILKLSKYITLTFPELNPTPKQGLNKHSLPPTSSASLTQDNSPSPDTSQPPFIIYTQWEHNNQLLMINIDQHLHLYIRSIIDTIGSFFKQLKQTTALIICPNSIQINYIDNHIHIISELYYYIVCVVCFMPRLYYTLKYSVNSNYIHANYVFSSSEIDIFYRNKNDSFKCNSTYLKSIFLKTLSICMKNYYCIIQSDQDLDIIPIYDNMSNSTITSLLERSSKAYLSKGFLISFLSTMLRKLDSNVEWPIISLNLHSLNTPPGIQLHKIYSTSSNYNIPIVINVIHSDTMLHVSLSYKKIYNKFKTLFQEVVNELLK
jgi:hypothetical protein